MRGVTLLVVALSGCASLIGFEDHYEREGSSGGSPSASAGSDSGSAGKSSSAGNTGRGGGDAGSGNAPPAGGDSSTGDGGSGTGNPGTAGASGSGSTPELALDHVAAGSGHACGIRPNGTLVCWGGFYSDYLEDVPAGSFVEVASGDELSCARDEDGYVQCWGWAETGTPPNVPFQDIDVGGNIPCGVQEDGVLVCWGDWAPSSGLPSAVHSLALADSWGCALHHDFSIECFSSSYTPPPGSFDDLVGGVDHLCALAQGSSTASCWGFDSAGETDALSGVFTMLTAGDGYSCGLRDDHSVECWGDSFKAVTTAPPGSFTEISAGDDFACGITTNGFVKCWGDSTYDAEKPPSD